MRGEGSSDRSSVPEDVAGYVDRLGERLDPDAVVLFGSRAGAHAHLQSDYDLLVIAEDLPADFWQRQDLLWEGKPHSVDVLGFTPEEVRGGIYRGLILDALLQGTSLYGDPAEFRRLAEEHLRTRGLVRTSAGYVRKPA